MADSHEVHFPNQPDYTIVEQLHPDQLDAELAYSALKNIVVPTLQAQFEGPATATKLPAGTIAQHYRPEDEAGVQQYQRRMAAHMQQGSAYWFARRGGGSTPSSRLEAARLSMPSGLIKVSPSRGRLDRLFDPDAPPNMFLNDILVAPAAQNAAMGTEMLDAVLRFGGYSGEARLILNGYKDNSRANAWFASLGLRRKHLVRIEPVEFSGHKLPQVRFDSGKTVLRRLVLTLQDRRPDLLHAIERRQSDN